MDRQDGAKRDSSPPPASLNASATNRRSLNSFSFLSSWGTQRILHCVNITSTNDKKALRSEEVADSSSPSKPWNLRTRRANPNRASDPNFISIPDPNYSKVSSDSPSPPGILTEEKCCTVNLKKSEDANEKKRERCEFSVALKKQEIECDFLKIKGTRPPRRPKKRAKYIQRQLDSIFPGLLLSEITPDLYEIDVETTADQRRSLQRQTAE